MGIFQRIKEWFLRRGQKRSGPTATQILKQARKSSEAPVEIETLIEEHDQLTAERQRLRKEIEVIDVQYSGGEIRPADRDREYRTRLARAGNISMRQIQIRDRLNQLGYPVPADWKATH